MRADHKACAKGKGRWAVKNGTFNFHGIGLPACQTCTADDAQCLHSVEIRPRCPPAATPAE